MWFIETDLSTNFVILSTPVDSTISSNFSLFPANFLWVAFQLKLNRKNEFFQYNKIMWLIYFNKWNISYTLATTFSIGTPSFNSLNLFIKLRPTLANSPLILPKASIELLKLRIHIDFLIFLIVLEISLMKWHYRSTSESVIFLPSFTSLKTLMPAFDASLAISYPTESSDLLMNKREYFNFPVISNLW